MARVSSEQRRRDLIAAATQLIREEGPAAVQARKVADRAGAPLGIVHYAFQDLDELMELANAEVLGTFLRVLQDLKTDRGVRQVVNDFLLTYWHLMRDNENETLAFFETFVSLLRPGRSHSSYAEAQQLLVDLMSEAEKHDARPANIPLPQLATLLIMAGDGLSLIHLARRDNGQTAQDVKQMITAMQHLV